MGSIAKELEISEASVLKTFRSGPKRNQVTNNSGRRGPKEKLSTTKETHTLKCCHQLPEGCGCLQVLRTDVWSVFSFYIFDSMFALANNKYAKSSLSTCNSTARDMYLAPTLPSLFHLLFFLVLMNKGYIYKGKISKAYTICSLVYGICHGEFLFLFIFLG